MQLQRLELRNSNCVVASSSSLMLLVLRVVVSWFVLVTSSIGLYYIYDVSVSTVVVLQQHQSQLFESYITTSNTIIADSSSSVNPQQQQQQQQLLRTGSNVRDDSTSIVQWHIKPIKPHHTGHVSYVTEISPDMSHLIYKRIFNAPCGYGMLVFNVGPAALYEPYTYELYEDAYAYSNNEGLCVLYPSYTGIQESTEPLWSFNDEMEMTVPLGDTPTQISTRIVIPPNTKAINVTNNYHGGDYLIIRDGNFYNPMYYKNLKNLINHWPPSMTVDEIPMKLLEFMSTTTTTME